MNYSEIALNIVSKEFASKKDKAGKPYIDHLKRVAFNSKKLAALIAPSIAGQFGVPVEKIITGLIFIKQMKTQN
jgi:hypothetical protein